MIYAQDTSTSVEKTRAELETTLSRFGADAFGYMTEGDRAMIQFKIRDRGVRFILPLPNRNEKRFTQTTRYSKPATRTPEQAGKEWEQACRSAWRALFLAVKAKLVAVDCRISSFETEFMAYLILPSGRTVAEEVMPAIEHAYKTGITPNFTLALPAPGET